MFGVKSAGLALTMRSWATSAAPAGTVTALSASVAASANTTASAGPLPDLASVLTTAAPHVALVPPVDLTVNLGNCIDVRQRETFLRRRSLSARTAPRW